MKKPSSDEDTELCDSLLEIINEINVELLNWKDPIASQVIEDRSSIIDSLDANAKIQFMVRVYLSLSSLY